MTRRITAVPLLLCIALLSACAAPIAEEVVHYEFLSVEYDSAQQLYSRADAVVEGVVIGSTVERIDLGVPAFEGEDPVRNPYAGVEGEPNELDTTIVFTVYQVEIVNARTGRYQRGDVVDVRLAGGELDGVTYVSEASPTLTRGSTYAFFLHDLSAGSAEPLNPTQSVYRRSAAGGFQSATQGNALARDITGDLAREFPPTRPGSPEPPTH